MIKRSRVRVPARAAGEFSSPRSIYVLTLISNAIRSTPVLLQYHMKDPGHSAKNAGGRLQLSTYVPSLGLCGFA